MDSPEKENVDKMSAKCRKNVRKMSENCPKGLKHDFRTFFGLFLPVWSMLLFGDPVQCSPITRLTSPTQNQMDHRQTLGVGANRKPEK